MPVPRFPRTTRSIYLFTFVTASSRKPLSTTTSGFSLPPQHEVDANYSLNMKIIQVCPYSIHVLLSPRVEPAWSNSGVQDSLRLFCFTHNTHTHSDTVQLLASYHSLKQHCNLMPCVCGSKKDLMTNNDNTDLVLL